MNDVYSVNEAAEKLGLESSHIRRLLAKGEIEGKKLGRDWVVLSLDYKRRRKPKTKRQGKTGSNQDNQRLENDEIRSKHD
ncbi:helix-turn-helix domain-containing protein [Chloroflexota bacterium]